MGIPKFFRWLSERYPLINQTVDFDNPGPSFDCLYLDMNGIIHNCTHPKDDIKTLTGKSEDDMVLLIFKYIDNLVNIVKPKKLLYMAIDGVAPRAKMNQQRSRRFKTARDAEEAMKELVQKGGEIPKEKPFDSNCITPGTPFMARLSEHLKFFIRKRMQEDATWRKLSVVFSGHEVPGEGEHKIMEYIRHQKAQPDYEHNLSHCMYGLDADLIMLSLVTHEPHFALLREEGVLDRTKKKTVGDQQTFHLLHISLLREFLELDFRSLKSRLNFEYNAERIIDDFVLMCFLIGNDFVPNLPTFDIVQGSLNNFFDSYKTLLPTLDGYIVENGVPVISRFEKVFQLLADQERQNATISTGALDEISFNILDQNPDEDVGLARALFARSSDRVNLEEYDDSGDDGEAIYRKTYYESKFKRSDAEFVNDLRKSYLEAMFWVSHYYYHGCVSWSWYFPYHYAPLALDLTDLSSITIDFTLSKPFTPLEQLLGVLPPGSKSFLPLPYQRLMTDPMSPLLPYYPLHFELDMNDKKNDWEAIVVIPFIDEKLLLEATRSVAHLLSDEEKARNRFGKALCYTFDPKATSAPYPSKMKWFGDISMCFVLERELALLPFPEGITDPFVLLSQTRPIPGFPSLKSLQFKTKLTHCNVTCFGTQSRRESLVIYPANNDDPVEAIVQKYLGKSCWIWPYNREALVENISSKFGENRKGVDGQENFSGEESGWWLKDAEYIQSKYKTSQAVLLEKVDVILSVRPLLGLVMNSQGQLSHRWSNSLQKIPSSLILSKNPSGVDPRFDVPKSLPLDVQFPLNSQCVSIRHDSFGSLGTVMAHSARGVSVKFAEISVHPPFLGSILASHKQQFFSTIQVAKSLRLSPKTINKITASVTFEPGSYNFGLQLKFSGKNKQLMGYTFRSVDEDGNFGQWEYSSVAVTLIAEYLAKYPEVFVAIEKEPGRDLYDSAVLFPHAPMIPKEITKQQPTLSESIEIPVDEENDLPPSQKMQELRISQEVAASLVDEEDDVGDVVLFQPSQLTPVAKNLVSKESKTKEAKHESNKKKPKRRKSKPQTKEMVNSKLIELKKWLAELPTAGVPKVDSGAIALTPECVKALEKAVDTWTQPASNKVVDCLASYLLRPLGPTEVFSGKRDVAEFDSHFQNFQLGDRVVYLRDSGPLSFGTKGFVIAIKGDFIDVLLDKPAFGGVTLSGICSELRGQCVSKGSLLNISKKKEKKPKDANVWKNRDQNSSQPKQPELYYNQKVLLKQNPQPTKILERGDAPKGKKPKQDPK